MVVPEFIPFRPSEGGGEELSARMIGGITVEVLLRAPFDGFMEVLPSGDYIVYRRHYGGAQMGELHFVIPSGWAPFPSWLVSIYRVVVS